MTDETPATGPGDGAPEEPVPPVAPPEHDMATITAGAGNFTSGEGLVAFAGMVLLAIWVIFDVFLDDYGLDVVELLLAVTVVVIPRMNRKTVESVHPVAVIMKVAGYAIAIVGAIFIISALEEGFYDNASTIIGALLNYAAYVMAFLGARQIKI